MRICICIYIYTYNTCIHMCKLQPSCSREPLLGLNFSMAYLRCLTKRPSPSAVSQSMVLTDLCSMLPACCGSVPFSEEIQIHSFIQQICCEFGSCHLAQRVIRRRKKTSCWWLDTQEQLQQRWLVSAPPKQFGNHNGSKETL